MARFNSRLISIPPNDKSQYNYDSFKVRNAYKEDHKITNKTMVRCSYVGCRKVAPFEKMVIHHILPRSLWYHLTYDTENMMILCKECHDILHNTYVFERKKELKEQKNIEEKKPQKQEYKTQKQINAELRDDAKWHCVYCHEFIDKKVDENCRLVDKVYHKACFEKIYKLIEEEKK